MLYRESTGNLGRKYWRHSSDGGWKEASRVGRRGQSEEITFNLGPRDKDLENRYPWPREQYMQGPWGGKKFEHLKTGKKSDVALVLHR